jgi:hypothetical protein
VSSVSASRTAQQPHRPVHECCLPKQETSLLLHFQHPLLSHHLPLLHVRHLLHDLALPLLHVLHVLPQIHLACACACAGVWCPEYLPLCCRRRRRCRRRHRRRRLHHLPLLHRLSLALMCRLLKPEKYTQKSALVDFLLYCRAAFEIFNLVFWLCLALQCPFAFDAL